MELQDAAIRDRMEGLVAHVAVQGAHRSAVRNEQDPAAGVVTRDPLDRREHTRRVLLARLAVRPLAAREPLLDLRARQAGPRADVDLAQARVCDDGHAVRRGDDLRGLVRALEVARVDRVERDEAQLFGQLAGLRASGVVQRRIGPALPDPVAVPVGLAVSCEEDRRHATATVAARWTWDSKGRYASSPARPPASDSSSQTSCVPRARASSARAAATKAPATCTSSPTSRGPTGPEGWWPPARPRSAASTASSTTSGGRRSASSTS